MGSHVAARPRRRAPDDPGDLVGPEDAAPPGPVADGAADHHASPVDRLVSSHPWATHLALAATVLLGGYASALAADGTVFGLVEFGLLRPGGRVAELAAPVCLVGSGVGAAVLLARNAHPWAVTAVLTVLAAVSLAAGGVLGVLGVCLGLSLHAVAARAGTRPALVTGAVVLVVVTAAVLRWQVLGAAEVVGFGGTGPAASMIGPPVQQLEEPPFSAGARSWSVLLLLLVLAVGVATGAGTRARREHARILAERYAALARERDAVAALARQAERARIAREMHDVVAHHVSVMVALSDGALAALGRAPDRSRDAMTEVARTGRGAIADMRGVLGALAPDDESGDLVHEGTAPTSTDLRSTVERFRAAGLPVHAEGLGTPLPHDTAARLAVVRVVGEALTNVLRHAPQARSVAVTVRQDATTLHVEVVDSGDEHPPDGTGSRRGLVGMRERATLHGGRLDAGPLEDGGWAVRLTLPTPAPAVGPPDQLPDQLPGAPGTGGTP